MSRAWKVRVVVYLLLAAVLAGGTWWAFKWAEGPRTGAPDVLFVATPQEAVEKMLDMAQVTKDDVVYDLGCGDGRFAITAAKKFGCRAVGFEIQPHLVELARENADKAGVADLVEIHERDILADGGVDLRPATVVTLFLLPEINVKLLPRLKQLRPGSRVVSYLFDIAGVEPKEEIVFKRKDRHLCRLYLWETPLTIVDR